MIAFFLTIALAAAAPAPAEKPLPPFSPVGVWTITYSSDNVWRARMFPDGFWVCRIGTTVYLGEWKWEKRGESVVVVEHTVIYQRDEYRSGLPEEYNWVGNIVRVGPAAWTLNGTRVQVKAEKEW